MDQDEDERWAWHRKFRDPSISYFNVKIPTFTLDPNFQPPFERISDPQIPLTRLKME
jgi:hypothetical protein